MTAGAATRRTVLAGGCTLPAAFVFGQETAVLSPREAHEGARARRLLLIDIRTAEEWADTGLPQDALPLDADMAGFEVRLAALRLDHPGKRITLIDRSGALAASVRQKLVGRGWRDLATVRGGMLGPEGWLAQKLPVAVIRDTPSFSGEAKRRPENLMTRRLWFPGWSGQACP